jgi:F0F1-type ATP synthase membrane subunit c/vacuolar-type H+-ATPase subunit K
MWFVWSLGLLVGCGALVLAGNGLAWSAILPRLTRSQPWRNVTVTVLVVIFALLSVALTFGLVLAAILTYQYWGPLVPWRQ